MISRSLRYLAADEVGHDAYAYGDFQKRRNELPQARTFSRGKQKL